MAAHSPGFAAPTLIIGEPADLGGGNCFPFGCPDGTRYQQVYSSALFSGPILINEVDFFNTQFRPGLAIIDTATYVIDLSTTAKAVNGLDTINFDSNVGADNAPFFSGVLGGPIGGSTFTILGSSFPYDPAMGNLLLDLHKTLESQFGGAALDARNGTFGGDSSRAQNFGGGFESYGLVTGFGFTETTAVPEPATLFLLGSGLVGLGSTAWRRRRG